MRARSWTTGAALAVLLALTACSHAKPTARSSPSQTTLAPAAAIATATGSPSASPPPVSPTPAPTRTRPAPTPSPTGATPGTPGPTASGPAPPTPPGVSLVITQADSGQTFTLPKGSTAELRLGNGMTWSDLSVAGGAVTIAPETLPTDAGYQAWRLTAVARGSVVVTATGRPTCRAGELCAAFVVLFRVTINVP